MTIKLRKVPEGYQTLDGRYNVEHQDGITDCDHPLCYQLHRRFHEHGPTIGSWSHSVTYVAWHIWDNVADDYAGHNGPNEYDTKREAVAARLAPSLRLRSTA